VGWKEAEDGRFTNDGRASRIRVSKATKRDEERNPIRSRPGRNEDGDEKEELEKRERARAREIDSHGK
jgi:hypothetical protein